MEEKETKEIRTTLKKNQTADIPTKSGGKYSYQYVDIAQIHDYLEENNMSYYQYIDRINDDDYIMTVPIINGEEKPPRRGSRVVQATLMGNNNPAQEQGSALTYARRYSLLMAFGLATEDDDANSLNKKSEPQEMTQEEALEFKFTFGQYKGAKVYDIYLSDKQYIEYLVNGETPNQRIKACYELFEKMPIGILNRLIEETSTSIKSITDHYQKDNLKDLTNEEIEESIKILEAKKRSLEKSQNMLEEAEKQISGGA